MNEKQKNEIDELITLLIDGEQTERQKTELKRLIRHDSAVKERLHVLYRQKKFLNALPVEKAPANLVDDITAAIERKSILETFDRQAQGVSDTKHLLLRRLLTTAAMLFLPVGFLSMVIWQIVKPPSRPADLTAPSGIVKTENPPLNTPFIKGLAQELPFDGILTLHTDRHVTVSNFVEKAIFDQGLITAALPNRTADVTTFQVTATPGKIAALVDALSSAWPRCSEVSLGIMDKTAGNTLKIADVQPSQIKTLAAESSSVMLGQLAQKYQSSNASKKTLLADSAERDGAVPELGVPMLTGRERPSPAVMDDAQATVSLRIHIKRKID